MMNNYNFSVTKFAFLLFLLAFFKLHLLQAQDCNFKESGGVIMAEVESTILPANWVVTTQGGLTYVEWDGQEQFGNPGTGTITYKFNFTKTGIYRFQWRNKINKGNKNTENNDTWLKMPNNENIVFFGHQGNAGSIASDLAAKNTSVVFPDGSGLGNPANGSKNGWFKAFVNASGWSWNTNVNDENPYDLYVKVNTPGTYELQVSARSIFHALDKIVLYHLPTLGDDLPDGQLDGIAESANNCPVTKPSTNNTDGECEFEEVNGIAVMEAESNVIPSQWSVSLKNQESFIEWIDEEFFGTPGEGTITYKVSFSKTGLYRLQWRNKINQGTDKSQNNDTWLKMPNNQNVVFFGYKGNNDASASDVESELSKNSDKIVFPKGTDLGNDAAGSKDEWLKIYTNNAGWTWETNTNDETPFHVYVKINNPGVYELNISGRAKFHAIDKIVLYHIDTHGNGLSDESLVVLPESGCAPKLPFTNDSKGDSLALGLLFERTAGANWNTPWDVSKPMDQWAGVKLDTSRRVIELNLINRGLKGALPAELAFLSKLQKLQITGNGQLSGRIPDLDKMTGLTNLDFSNNGGLGGSLAPIGNLTKLKVIRLPNNQVSGGLPSNINKLTDLLVLDVSNNLLAGNLPTGISNLTKLVTLNLSGNAFTGSLPTMTALKALKTLDVSDNSLSGVIAGLGIGALTNLELLGLGNNEFTGPIFGGVVNLVKLKKLDMGNNQFDGSVPADIGNLVALTELDLSNNQLSGALPATISGLVNLTTALFNDNQFDGTVPGLSGFTKLNTLALQNNNLSGLPNLSASSVANLSVENNKLTFEDILPNVAKLNSYAPQDSVGEKKDVTLVAGQQLVIDLGIDKGVNTSIYQWSKNGVFFANTLESKLVIDNVDIQHLGEYTCKITNPQLPELTLVSLPVNVKVNEPPVFTSTPVTAISTDSTYTYNIVVTDPNADDSVAISAPVLPDWLTFTDNGDGTAVLTGQPSIGDCSKKQVTLRAVDKGGLDSTQSFAIDIAANFRVVITPSKEAICKGDNVTFTANLTNPGPNPVYQWFINDEVIEGLNAATFTTSTLKTNDVLKVKVTTEGAPCLVNTVAESEPLNIQVTEVTTMSVILNAEQEQVCAGEPATFSTIVGSPGDSVTFQWYLNAEAIAEATGATYTSSDLQDGDALQVKVNAKNPGCLTNDAAESKVETVSVIQSLTLDVSLKADTTVAIAGDPVKFTASTSYTASPVQYQWLINGNVVENESSATFISNSLQNNDKVKVKLTADSVSCLQNTAVESEEITMTIDAGIALQTVSKSGQEETEMGFTSADFAEAFTSELGSLAAIKVMTLPAHGTLQLSGAAVNAEQEIAVDKISELTYLPENNFSGEDGFQWNGKAEETQYGVSNADVIITVAPVNDPPVFTLDRDTIQVNQAFENIEEITIVPGDVPANESDQVVTYTLEPAIVTFANVEIDQNAGKVLISALGGRIGTEVVTVVANDGQGENNTYSQTFLLEIKSSLNTGPFDISLSSFNIPENQQEGATIATINVGDNDDNDVHQIVLDRNDMYPDNALFTVEGYDLKSNVNLNFEEKQRMIINLKATDKVGHSLSKQLVINIVNQNDAPSDIVPGSTNVTGNLTIGGVVTEFVANDEDPDDVHLYSLVGEAKDNNLFVFTGNKLVLNRTLEAATGEELQIRVRVDDGKEGVFEKDITLTVISPEDVFANIKTGITPNGDGWNDTWQIDNIESYPNARVEVYDSWGRRVFYSVGYDKEWDGTFENKALPAGSYYYIIDTQVGKPTKGTITLMR